MTQSWHVRVGARGESGGDPSELSAGLVAGRRQIKFVIGQRGIEDWLSFGDVYMAHD